MNKTLSISVIVLVAVIMGMSSAAIGLPPATAHQDNPGSHQKWWSNAPANCKTIGQAEFCKVWINVDHIAGCTPGDVVLFMSKKAIAAQNIPLCP